MGGRRRPRAVSVDDMGVDYTCILDTEDRRRRWSEAVTDSDLRNSVRLNKLFRQLQRQVYCRGKEDVLQGELGGGGLERAGRPSSMRRVILKQRVADTDTSCVKMQTRAKAIITGGTMALLLLAASLVTTTFLMSPVIQQIWDNSSGVDVADGGRSFRTIVNITRTDLNLHQD